jgi:homoserine kinase
VASFKDGEGRLISRRLPLSHRLGFLIVIPHKELSTEAARKVLLKEYPLSTVTYDASRLTLLPSALKEGNIDLLFELLKDKIHVPYRLPLIEEGKTVEEISEKYHLPFTISGAGSSLLLLFDKKDKCLLDKALADLKQKISKTCDFKILVPSFKGAEIREEKEDEQ